MSAELAVALPAVLLVLAAGLGALRAGAEQVRLADAAGLTARGLGRHDARMVAPIAGTTLQVSRGGDLVCATLTARTPLLGDLAPLPIRARSGALDEPTW